MAVYDAATGKEYSAEEWAAKMESATPFGEIDFEGQFASGEFRWTVQGGVATPDGGVQVLDGGCALQGNVRDGNGFLKRTTFRNNERDTVRYTVRKGEITGSEGHHTNQNVAKGSGSRHVDAPSGRVDHDSSDAEKIAAGYYRDGHGNWRR